MAYDILIDNPNDRDGGIFHADHGNLDIAARLRVKPAST